MKYKVIFLALLLGLIAFPLMAQDIRATHVSFNGFRFGFNSALATNVNISQYPGDPAEFGPGFAEPKHTQFGLYNEFPAPQSIVEGVGAIRVYDTDDLVGFTEHENRMGTLQTMLGERTDLAQFMTAADNANDYGLPFIPVFAAGQTIRAQAEYLDTSILQGIRYITAYQEVAEPLASGMVYYTFQGITNDGSTYVTLLFRLNGVLAAEPTPDPETDLFVADTDDYIAVINTLNAAAPGDFAPSLDTLDALVQSIQTEGQ